MKTLKILGKSFIMAVMIVLFLLLCCVGIFGVFFVLVHYTKYTIPAGIFGVLWYVTYQVEKDYHK